MSMKSTDCRLDQNTIVHTDLTIRKPLEIGSYSKYTELNTLSDLFDQYITDELLHFDF